MRRPLRPRSPRRLLACTLPLLCAAAPGCIDHPLKAVEYQQGQENDVVVEFNPNKNVDILFVIDNSGSMGEEQANLSANFGGFIEILEAPDVAANYRIAVTTTDNGNPRCQGTSPEGGKMQLSSCRGREGDFLFTGNPMTDAFDEACASICSPQTHAALADGVLPTTVTGDAEAKPRPWIESNGGITNLPESVTTTEAFQCLGPQGISGCGFEQHLESMYKSLSLALTDTSNEAGFLRDDAILAVIFVTDELDCSHNNDFNEIFVDNSVFWSDPDAANPTSAVCWNAGVECVDGECRSANFDATGAPGASDDDAVMRPVERYTDLVQGIVDAKTDDRPVIVGVLSGVPEGYEDFMAEIEYADTLDPTFQENFGIGPGCSVGGQQAVPPVRLREFGETFAAEGERNLYSICTADYTPPLKRIADEIAKAFEPACFTGCLRDADPTTPEFEPSCNVVEDLSNGQSRDVPQCVLAGDAWVQPQADSEVCWVPLTSTEPGMADSMSSECVEGGYQLEFRLERVGAAPNESRVRATCEVLSQSMCG